MDQNSKMQGNEPSKQKHKPSPDETKVEAAETTEPKLVTVPEGLVAVEAPKKNNSLTGLIAALIVFVVLALGGVGFAIWYYVCYNNSENVAYSAVENFLRADNIVTQGSMTFKTKTSSVDEDPLTVMLTLNSSASSLPNSSELWLLVSTDSATADDLAIKAKLGTVQLADGVIYFKAEQLLDTVDRYLAAYNVDLDQFGEIGDLVYDFIETFDGEWWRISLPELMDALEVPEKEAKPIEDFYSCTINALQKDHSEEFTKLYSDHRFLKIERSTTPASASGSTEYVATLDFDHLANFLNAVPETAAAESFYTCYNDYLDAAPQDSILDERKISPEEFRELSADELANSSLKDISIDLEITDFGHQLQVADFRYENDDYEVAVSLGFEYKPAESVTAPENYRPFTDLVDEVIELSIQILSTIFEDSDLTIDDVINQFETETEI